MTFPIYGKIRNVPNHQPGFCLMGNHSYEGWVSLRTPLRTPGHGFFHITSMTHKSMEFYRDPMETPISYASHVLPILLGFAMGVVWEWGSNDWKCSSSYIWIQELEETNCIYPNCSSWKYNWKKPKYIGTGYITIWTWKPIVVAAGAPHPTHEIPTVSPTVQWALSNLTQVSVCSS